MPKLIMSLRSGLLSESTNALNTLLIRSSDQNCNSDMKLTKYHGFLKLLLEYFKRFLSELLPDLFDYEASNRSNQFDGNNNLDNQELSLMDLDNQIINVDHFENEKSINHQHSSSNETTHLIKDNSFILTSLHPRRKTSGVDDERLKLIESTNELNAKSKHFKMNFENEAKIIELNPLCTISEFEEDNYQKMHLHFKYNT